MMLPWAPYLDAHWPMSLFVILRTSGQKIVRLSLNLLCAEYMDNTFLFFRSKEHVETFINQRKSISITSGTEQNGSLSFRDIKKNRENNKVVTSVYRKPKLEFLLILKVLSRNIINVV